MSKVYIVTNGDPFVELGGRMKYFSTEEKARRFIEEDYERIRNKYKIEGEPKWDEYKDCFLHRYGSNVFSYHYCERELL